MCQLIAAERSCSTGVFYLCLWSSVFSSLFVSTFMNTLKMFDSRYIVKTIIALAFFHIVGIRLSDKHLVYSLASVFEMVSSPAFNVSMFIIMVVACCSWQLHANGFTMGTAASCLNAPSSLWSHKK